MLILWLLCQQPHSRVGFDQISMASLSFFSFSKEMPHIVLTIAMSDLDDICWSNAILSCNYTHSSWYIFCVLVQATFSLVEFLNIFELLPFDMYVT